MSIEDFPLLDTTVLDAYAASYAAIKQTIEPAVLMDLSATNRVIEDELLEPIRHAAMEFAGKAILASAQIAIGLDNINALQPAINAVDGETCFAGRLVGVSLCNFTDVLYRAKMIPTASSPELLPGIVFETSQDLEELAPEIGIVSLAPYCALLPSSLYELRAIPFAA